MIKKFIFHFAFLVTVLTSCSYIHSGTKNNNINLASIDLDSIRKRGKLITENDFNSINYFIYKREPIGFKYKIDPEIKKFTSGIIVKNNYHAVNTKRISRYDDLIKKYSKRINWDWRLLSSLICQESHFNPKVVSLAGAYGLMQLMPGTGRNFGIDISASPENNIKAGIRYITWLHLIFDRKIPDEKERINFILASYNAGPGHVLDAMKLAEKNGKDPQKWDSNVAVWILKKSERRYYNDKVVKNGYFNGKESVAFVAEVMNRYEHYKNIVPSEKLANPPHESPNWRTSKPMLILVNPPIGVIGGGYPGG